MNNPPADDEQRGAWLASLNEDESAIVSTPLGWRFQYVMVAITKQALLTDGITAGDKLHLLEKLNGLVDKDFTTEMLAAIEPASDLEYQIYREARSLDGPDDKAATASFNVLTSCRVFWHLTTLNPSYLKVIKLAPSYSWRQKAGTSQSALPAPATEAATPERMPYYQPAPPPTHMANGALSPKQYIEVYGNRARVS